jgi:hypothetical protein
MLISVFHAQLGIFLDFRIGRVSKGDLQTKASQEQRLWLQAARDEECSSMGEAPTSTDTCQQKSF